MHVQEQEMEIEALEAILMDEFQEIHPSKSGLNTSNRCFQITLSPQDDKTDEYSTTPVQLGSVVSHTEKYPDKIPLLNVKRVKLASLTSMTCTDNENLVRALENGLSEVDSHEGINKTNTSSNQGQSQASTLLAQIESQRKHICLKKIESKTR